MVFSFAWRKLIRLWDDPIKTRERAAAPGGHYYVGWWISSPLFAFTVLTWPLCRRSWAREETSAQCIWLVRGRRLQSRLFIWHPRIFDIRCAHMMILQPKKRTEVHSLQSSPQGRPTLGHPKVSWRGRWVSSPGPVVGAARGFLGGHRILRTKWSYSVSQSQNADGACSSESRRFDIPIAAVAFWWCLCTERCPARSRPPNSRNYWSPPLRRLP